MRQTFRKVFNDEGNESHDIDIGMEHALRDLKEHVSSPKLDDCFKKSNPKMNTWNPILTDEDEWE